MKLLYLTKYIYSFLFQKKKRNGHFYLESKLEESAIRDFWEKTAGGFYNFFDNKREQRKIKLWSRKKELEKERLIFDVIRKSRKQVITFMVVFVALFILDFTLNELFSDLLNKELITQLPNGYEDLVEEFLKLMIPTLSAFIALIFSLYGVVTQVVMDKYSTSVTKYINEDKFPNLFLHSLVFINLFGVYLYIRILLFPSIPSTVSFLFIVLSVCWTMIALLLFKGSYTYSIKPENLFRRLGFDILEQIDIASGFDESVKNSRSIIYHSGKRVRYLFSVFESLFDDLVRNKNFKDIYQAPIVLSSVFLDYIEKRKFIDEEQGWWFPQKKQIFEGNNIIKVNYEIQGKGVLHIPVIYKDWFEERTKEIFSLMKRQIPIIKEDSYTRQVIQSYGVIISGRNKKNEHGLYDGKIHGAYENGELEIFKMFYEEFSELPEYLDKASESIEIEYINTLFSIVIVLIDENNKILPEVAEFLEGTVEDGKLTVTLEDIKSLSFPKYVHTLICELIDGLQAEVVCEGRVVTPVDFFVREVLEKIKRRNELDSKELLGCLLEDIKSLVQREFENKKYQKALRFIELELRFFQRLAYLGKFELIVQHKGILQDIKGYIVSAPIRELKKTNLFDIIDQLIFSIALEGEKDILNSLIVILIYILNFVCLQKTQDSEEKLLLMRTLVVIGGFLFLLGEFEDDFTLLKIYKDNLIVFYPDIVKTLPFLESLINNGGTFLLGRNMNREMTKYGHWFGIVKGKIDQLPKKLFQTKIRLGMSEAADHPSNFIKEISVGVGFDIEQCNQRFIEWFKENQKKDLTLRFTSLLKILSLSS